MLRDTTHYHYNENNEKEPMIMKLLKTAAPPIVAALLLAACGGAEDPESGVDEPEHGAPAAESAAALPRTPAADGARVFFITPVDGDTVSNPIMVEFGIEGMSVVTAGDATPDSGHHHLIIDADLPDPTMPIPANDNYIHFGDGSTSTEITLDPGTHTLKLLLGDHLHVPHDPPVTSETITITVE